MLEGLWACGQRLRASSFQGSECRRAQAPREQGYNGLLCVTFRKPPVTPMFTFLICKKGIIQDYLFHVAAVGKKIISVTVVGP